MAKYKYPQQVKSEKDFRKLAKVSKEEFEQFLLTHKKSWHAVKICLRHSQCPKEIRNTYENHEVWYIRLAALLVMPVRKINLSRAVTDKDFRVRRAGYRTYIETFGWSKFCDKHIKDFVADPNPKKFYQISESQQEEVEAYIEISQKEIKSKMDLNEHLVSSNQLVREFAKTKYQEFNKKE